MLKEICCDIKDLILSSGYVNTHFEFCELIQNGDVVYPAQYTKGGNYEQVFNNDVNGNSYVRKTGKVGFTGVSGSDAKRIRACGGSAFVTLTYPLRLVMVIPKSKLEDDAFSDELLAQEIIALVNSDVNLDVEGVRSLSYVVTSYDDDSLSIWKDEVKGMDYQMNFDYSYIAINFNAIIVVNTDCLTRVCAPY